MMLSELRDEYLASRIDVADSTMRGLQAKTRVIATHFDTIPYARLERGDVQAWVNEMQAAGKAPGTISQYLIVLTLMLDYAGVDPNPCRDRLLRKPKSRGPRIRLPTATQLAAMRACLAERYDRVVPLLEDAGLRISEAVALEWRDVDEARSRVFVRASKTPAGTRFITLDPLPQKPNGAAGHDRVCPGVTATATRIAFSRACEKAGVATISPHDCRHLHASRALHYGWFSPAELAARLGHANPAVTLQVYAHVLPPE